LQQSGAGFTSIAGGELAAQFDHGDAGALLGRLAAWPGEAVMPGPVSRRLNGITCKRLVSV
jgi:hypothetical protein